MELTEEVELGSSLRVEILRPENELRLYDKITGELVYCRYEDSSEWYATVEGV